MKKFRTWYDTIEEVEIISESARFVTEADGQRCARRNPNSRNYFDTFAEAKAFLIDHEKTKIISLLAKVKQHQETLRKIEGMVG